MASRASDSDKKGKKFSVQQANDSLGDLFPVISQIKKEIQDSRSASVKEKLRKNVGLVSAITSNHLSNSRKDLWMMDLNTNGSEDRLLSKVAKDINESANKNNEMTPTSTVKLPSVEKISPYTTWVFLDKNQRMADDQSVVGRRQIYYDQYGGETLISSDSEDDVAEPEVKHIFYEGEDQMLWNVLQEYGQTQEVLDNLSQFIDAKPSEILDRFNALKKKDQEKRAKEVDVSAKNPSERSTFLDKNLNAALDSFDNLFCRRCLVFDCRLHGCSQGLITSSEKQSSWCGLEENKDPCSDQCYLRARRDDKNVRKRSDTRTAYTTEALMVKDQTLLTSRKEERSNLGRDVTPIEKSRDGKKIADISPGAGTVHKVSAGASNEILGKRKVLKHVDITANKSTLGSYDKHGCFIKKQKKILGPDVAYVSADGRPDSNPIPEAGIRLSEPQGVGQSLNCQEAQAQQVLNSSLEWSSIEKELYLKGIEIFGKNSCLIARNLLSGLKTCVEVHIYMEDDGNAMLQASSSLMDLCTKDKGETESDHKEQDMPTRSRFIRKKGRARKLKYTWKSAVHPSTHKRIAGGKNQMLKHYTPCDCQPMCGKDCSCLRNGTCCEKYCGCSKSCKYRFRGCHCAKSQCRSRQCPCFAANRECDPDVCKNCWVSCGDGSLGEPPARGDGYKCGNMKLLLKQRQRILLSKSNVAGWGAFLKNPVNKNDYLGEYTGELITHKEADKRGKIYDRLHSSYLFDLNDHCVLDAYRKGDKLKFANHSSKPNCHAKVSLVAGDHRVGIYASEHIDAGEEIFYDYGYPPDTPYEWARKHEGSKRDDLTPNSHARKHQPC